MNNSYIGKTCPYCQFPLKADSEVVVCAECRIPHHRECWRENGGCTTFGHQGLRKEARLLPDSDRGEVKYEEDIAVSSLGHNYTKDNRPFIVMAAYLLILLGVLFILNTFSRGTAFRTMWPLIPLGLDFIWLFFQSNKHYLSRSGNTFVRKLQYLIVLLTILISVIFLGMNLGLWYVSIQTLLNLL